MENRQKEWMVEVYYENADPLIEKDLGIKKGTYYFITKEEKDKFCNILNEYEDIMLLIKYGYMTHKRTIFVCTLSYDNKDFVIHHDFGYEYSEDDVIYSFEEAYYSCDCARYKLIQDEYGKDAIPELDCGDEIELLDYHFEYLD